MSIPTGALIDSVKIIYERKYDTDTSIGISRVKTRVDGEEGPNHDNTDQPLIDTIVEVDITADRGWEWQHLLAGSFEVIAEAIRGDTDTEHTQSWDYLKVEVGYHTAVEVMEVVDSADTILFGLSILAKGSGIVVRFVDAAGNTFDGITELPPDNQHRISFAYNLPSADNLSLSLFIQGIQELALEGNSSAGSPAPQQFRYGWIVQPGADRSCWFDQLYIDDGDDLSDPVFGLEFRAPLITAKLPAAVDEDNFDTTGGTGAVGERPVDLANYRQQAATAQLRQNYTIEAADEGDIDLTGKTIVGYMGWVLAKKFSGFGGSAPQITVNGSDSFVPLTTTPAIYRKAVTDANYPTDPAGIGMVSSTGSPDTFLYECGVVAAYEGPIEDQILHYQLLTQDSVTDLIDDLRADPPGSYELCYRSSNSETAQAVITVSSLDQENGTIQQQTIMYVNGGTGRTTIVPGIEVQISVTVTGGDLSLGLWHRLNV